MPLLGPMPGGLTSTPGSAVINVINQWPIFDLTGYGPAQAAVSNTTGNALLAIVASGSDNASGYVPRLAVCDDAHNWWIYAGSNLSAFPGAVRRLDFWICPNAKAASVVNVAASMLVAGTNGYICEITGFPAWAQVDFVLGNNNYGNNVTLSGTQPGASDFHFACLATFGTGYQTVTPPTGLFSLASDVQGSSGDMGEIGLYPGYNTAPFSAGGISNTWTWTTSCNFVAVLIGFTAAPPAPVQVNSNWPGLLVEAAFGFRPGSTDGSMPNWTNVTSRVIDDEGNHGFKSARGRDYELTQPEAGNLQMPLNNIDGAFNPNNASSPFYPYVLAETPVRASAFWGGRQYGIAYVNASKWPQDFPDPQWGMTSFTGNDIISAASQGTMPSAYGGEVLADLPYSYYPFGEYYNNSHGQLFANQSRTNLKPMIGYGPPGLGAGLKPLQSGLAMNGAGDSATAIGITPTYAQAADFGGAGAFVRDPGLPQMNNGASVEFWTLLSPSSAGGAPAADGTLLNLVGAPGNYNVSQNGVRLQIGNQLGTSGVQLTYQLLGPTGSSILLLAPATVYTYNSMLHVVVTTMQSGSTWTLTAFVNGVQVGTTTGTSTFHLLYDTMTLGPVSLHGTNMYAAWYQSNQLAIYPWILPAARIAAHYATMNTASNGDTTAQRVGKLFGWAGLGLPYGSALSSVTPLLGNADQIQGSALADALYSTSVDGGDMYYAPATAVGEIWYAPRMSLYNKSPKYVFGDNGTTEIPYDPGSGFDYSDQYLFNIVSSQRTISSGQQLSVGNGQAQSFTYDALGVDAVAADLTSEAEYYPRGPLQQDIETTSDQDAYDRANWTLAKYKQPQLRANQIALDPTTNTSIWPVALGIEQGDIVTVNRRPIGAPMISLNCIVQMVEHEVGPDYWVTTITLAPYFPENAVIQLDNPSFDLLGDGVLGW